MAQIQVRDPEGIGIALLNVRLGANGESIDDAYDDKFTDFVGNTAWPNPIVSPSGYDLFLNYRNNLDEYESKTVHVDSLTNPTTCSGGTIVGQDIVIVLNEIPLPVYDLHTSGDKIITEINTEWKMKFGSNFLLAQLVAEGIDIKPFLYSGLNGYRIFCTSYNPSIQAGFKPFHPDNYPNWLNAIGDTLAILNANGKYAQLDLVCDNNIFGKDANFLRTLLVEVDSVANAHKGILGSLGNEVTKNGINPNDFTEPTGKTLWACGSGESGAPAPLSNGKSWKTQRQHLRRDIKMFIDIPPVDAPSYNLNPIIIFDETIGYWNNITTTGSRTGNIDWASKMGRIMSAFNGGVIHLDAGGHSKPVVGIEEECKDAFVEAFQ